MKDGLRDDSRYKAVKHEEREALFNEYISELKAADDEAEREAKAKREEQVPNLLRLRYLLALPLPPEGVTTRKLAQSLPSSIGLCLSCTP